MMSVKSKLGFLSRVFGTPARSSDGINYAFKCPNCAPSEGHKKKLVIKIDDDSYHCWVCDIKGRGLEKLLHRYVPVALEEYRANYCKNKNLKFDISDVDSVPEPLEIKNFKLLALQKGSLDPDIRATLKYVASRGLSGRDLWYFKLGTATSGRFRRRVIIPSFDSEGSMNYYAARAIDDRAGRKYINARTPKKDIVFNELNINWKRELTLVEGPFDLIKCDENATCILGSSLGEKYALFQEIVRNQTPIILALDPDVVYKAHSIAKRLAEYGIPIRMLDMGKFNDVGEMSKQDFLSAKSSAHRWTGDDRLFYMIDSIKSGSVLK
tara:strand:+ start:106 stop:1077 length:972 start_codon:yes stop_codon:yes gene_type:complete